MTERNTEPPAAANIPANSVTSPTILIIACSVLTVSITEAVMYLYRAVIN
ncbi:MAG: hypothetical protein M3083_18105 [Actinomycetota bacterium]|nr:hypothetical protein [Actinomycetota bacterium]